MINEKQVRHVAKLARINLTDAEVKKFSKQLSSVFEYMDILNELNTDKVKETSQVTGLSNVMGKDEVKRWEPGREELLKSTELPVDSKQIRVLPAIE
ncbi:MAG: Asp-tRNA(Asn)/Glu-tRNA(Gln) amidotransferase subunit GatC [Candidatus Gracilibacteria bacterium]|jgi:aspartyl-tRNA(Asn)/glutamyl-tRNA(Gln) amidotransferase subunit C